ncbi:MAG: HesA/MoeB/ThiF family protein [Promethearchaeota archaeon]
MDKRRYIRQMVMPSIGEDGQDRLANARVAVIGTGGLGSPILFYLAAAGVGFIRFIDTDVVDKSNLNRQILHASSRIGQAKIESALKTLQDFNPDIDFDPRDVFFDETNSKTMLKDVDYVIDASDNFKTKFLVNDTAVELGIPCTIGGVSRWEGQLMSVMPRKSACYRCVFSNEPPADSVMSPAELGIIGVTAGAIGVIAAAEAIKCILGFEEKSRLVNFLLVMDLRDINFTVIKVKRHAKCKACGNE